MEPFSENRSAPFPDCMPKLRAIVSFRPALDQLNKQRKATAALRQQWHQWMAQRLAPSPGGLRLVSHSAPGPSKTPLVLRPQEAAEGSPSWAKPLPSSTPREAAGGGHAAAAGTVKPGAAKVPESGGGRTVGATASGPSAGRKPAAAGKPDDVTAMPTLQPTWSLPSFSSFQLDALLFRRPCQSATQGVATKNPPRPSPPCDVLPARKRTADRKNLTLAPPSFKAKSHDRTTSSSAAAGEGMAAGADDGSRDENSPVPYHTAITRRPLRKGFPHEAHTFPTLTLGHCHLPQLMEREEEEEAKLRDRRGVPTASGLPPPGGRRDIREWQNEVVKVVPSRPQFSTPLPSTVVHDKVTTLRYPYKVINFDSTCHFYRSWTKSSEKEYVISPEWSSEKNVMQTTETSLVKKDLPSLV